MNIRPYAVTYPQLMNQALAQGLPDPDLARLCAACGHAERFFDGMYRGQGVPFLCHLMRTASIVLMERQPLDVVIAALVHAVYMTGMFSDRRVGHPTPAHRAEVRRAVGDDVEQWVMDYDRLPWRAAGALAAHVRQLPDYPERTRRLLIIRVANELEDYLDTALAYRSEFPLRERIVAGREQLLPLAQALGLHHVADELRGAYEASWAVQLPRAIQLSSCFAYEQPAHKRLRVGLRQRIWSRLSRHATH